MIFNKVHYLPVITVIWCGSTCIICYIISVLNQHVNPLFPYISETGTFTPDSCIFSIMLTIGSILLLINFYVRYKYIQHLLDKDWSGTIDKLNKASVILSFVAVLGLLMVANFQQTVAIVPHLIGAISGFASIGVYMTLQVIISFKTLHLLGKKVPVIIRTVICCIFFLCCIFNSIFGCLALTKFKGEDVTKWSKEDDGYEFRLVSVIAEWIIVSVTLVFIATFTGEFRVISLKEPMILPKIYY